MRWMIAVAAVALSSCDSEGPAGECTANSGCPGGSICKEGACAELCASDTDCDTGTICVDSTCGAGTRQTPEIKDVDGDGPDLCTGAGGNHCVATTIEVTGANLSGASFELDAVGGGSIALTPVGKPSDTFVALAVPESLVAGDYVLHVVNGAGSADQVVEVLKGDSGEQGPQGPQGQPGPQGPAGALDETQVAAMNAAITAAKVPVGTILAWHKSATGTPALPDGWLECNGQTVFDAESPYYTGAVPDLNGGNRFMRGNSASGAEGGSATHTHSFQNTSTDMAPDASHYTDGSFTNPANHLPPYFDVVWIIRIK